jgi:hypothetical protein
MKTTDIIKENDDREVYHDLNQMQAQAAQEPDPYVITQGVPRSWGNWRPKDASGMPINATFITLKTTEPRGGPMEVIRSIAYQSTGRSGNTVGPFKSIGIIGVYSPSGHSIQAAMKKAGYAGFKTSGLAFAFAPSIDGPTAELAFENLLSVFRSKQEKVSKQRERHRADAPKRAKAAAAARSHGDKAKRQALYDKYGKKNVLSVSARQIGGDDGGQWNVLINGHSMVSGLTHSEVPYYKKQAYEILLKRNGKQ